VLAENRTNPVYAEPLAVTAAEIREDRATLLAIMRRLEVPVDRVKVALGWTAEKLGRLKLNGRLLGYSPLSRLDELEILALGVTGKIAMWRALLRIDPERPDLDAAELTTLIERGERQLERIESCRQRAVDEALL
jgi:hypothetical protein